MKRLEVDECWGLPCIGYHVQSRPDRLSVKALQIVQHATRQIAPVALNIIPANALHLSVATLIPAEFSINSAETRWSRIEQAARRELAAHPAPDDLSMVFLSLKYTERAIILFTKDQPTYLTEMRARFSKLLTSAGIDHPGYDQAHITIARYAESLPLTEAASNPIKEMDVALAVRFEPFRLVRESRYPSLMIENI